MATTRLQSQAEANAYWANHEVKKWVVSLVGPKRLVTFGTGVARVSKSVDVYVSARTSDRAIACAVANTESQRWISKRARLATAQDLGCVYVAEPEKRLCAA